MKAKNSEKIIRGYLEFAGGLLISTALSMALLTGFIHTNGSEYKLMESKTQEYDKIYARQIALVDKVDSLYNYLVLMGSNDRLNQVVLQQGCTSVQKTGFANQRVSGHQRSHT